MNESAFKALEFDKIREVLADLTETPSGRARALGIAPSTEAGAVRASLDETSEVRRLADENHPVPLSALPDVEGDLMSLGIAGRALPLEAFVRLARLAAAANDARKRLLARAEVAPLLSRKAEALPILTRLETDVLRVIDVASEAVKDDASRELARIRGKSRRLLARVQRILDAAIASRDNQKILQEPLVTSRNARPVVPVRAECKGQFAGIVHGASASGATLFIEPMAAVPLTNELQALRDLEEEEIRRILSELTERVRPSRNELLAAVGILGEIDLAQAKARLGELVRGQAPAVSDAFELRLIEARHPLLIPEVAARAGLDPRSPAGSGPVPLTFRVAFGTKALVFTGPNTGGKTVALKTAGLLALMAQAGLHVPASSSSVFPVFRSVFADIGDDQSIGSSLSTFSSHLARIVEMERELENPALLILDEVGTGTDPSEGGALGTALLEHFVSRGAMVLASTHHGGLKAYALTTPGIRAASFDFDPVTYAPTYRVIEGAAGRSLAFEMAERLGLPRSVVARARSLQEERERQAEDLVSRLRADTAELETERLRLAEDRRKAEETRLRMEAEAGEERSERDRRLKAFRVSLEEELSSTRRELKELVAEARRAVDEVRASRREERRRLSELEKRIADRIEEVTAPLLEKQNEAAPSGSTEPLRAGMRVLVASFGMEGEVVRVLGDEAEVLVRDKKLRLPLKSLEALPELEPAGPKGGVTVVPPVEVKPTPGELNLIGCTVEEALGQVDKFLDDAVLSEYRQVRLIHGHGTGRLRKALREWLSSHPHVGKLESDHRGGVTVVELKD
jgi:DNA mismatch repair protein MutS2